jgi:chromosome segregation ATPase
MENSLRDAAGKSGKARLLVVAGERSEPVPEAYPSEQELQTYNLGLHKLREKLEAAEREESIWNASYTALATNLKQARQEMAALAEREEQLRSALSNTPIRDKATGLYIEPQAVR